MPRISAATVADHRARRRRAIVDAARALLEDDGAAAVTFAAVAARTGLARNSLYKYFTDRRALLGAVVLDVVPRWTDAIRAALDAEDDPRDKVAAYVRVQLDLVRDGGHRVARALAGTRDAEVLRAQTERAHREILEPIVGALRDLGEPDPRRAAGLLQGIVNAATTAIENGDDPRAVTERAVAMAVAAVGG